MAELLSLEMSTSAVQANRRNGQTGCRMRSGHREGYCRVCFISIWAGNKNCQSVPGSSKINGRIKSEREKKKKERKNKKETSCSIAAPLCSRSFHLPGYVDSNADAEQLIVTIVTIHRESKKEKKIDRYIKDSYSQKENFHSSDDFLIYKPWIKIFVVTDNKHWNNDAI